MFTLNSFKPVSFSLQSFKMAEEANSGRSGYWKLFFYNMQEEALKPHEQEQGKGTPQSTSRRASQKSVAKPKRARIHAVEEAEPPEEFEPLPKPMYRQQTDFVPNEITCLVQQNWVKLLGVDLPVGFYIPSESSANDEDEEELLLLLVA